MSTDKETKKNGNLPIFSVMLCLFFTLGLAASLSNYFDYEKTSGLVTGILIAPALIYHFLVVLNWFFNKA